MFYFELVLLESTFLYRDEIWILTGATQIL